MKMAKIRMVLLLVLIISGVVIAMTTSSGGPLNGTKFDELGKVNNRLPVYYIGKDVGKYFSSSTEIKYFRKIPEKHILVVDGGRARNLPGIKDFLREEILSGIPVIVVNGSTEIAKNLFEGQFSPQIVDGRRPDGKKIGEEKVYGFIIYQINRTLVSKVFISTDPSSAIVREAYSWAEENIHPYVGDFTIQASPYWNQIYQLNYTTGNDWQPYGRLNVRTLYYKLYNDGSGTYDWYNVHVRQQSVPGELLWNSGWKTADMYTWVDANYYRSGYFLSDYSPTTTSGASTVTVSVGVTAGTDGAQVSASQSWSYTIPDVVVYDQSDYSQELAKWWHNVDEGKAVGSNTYQIEPGATVRVPDGNPMDWREHYGVKYGKFNVFFWTYTDEGYVEFRIQN